MSIHNQIDLIEFPVASPNDLAKTRDFFTNVFGWNYTNYGESYSDTSESGTTSGLNSDQSATMPLTVIYSEDLEATKQKVLENGGKVLVDTYNFPGGKRFHFTEPSGNELAVWSK